MNTLLLILQTILAAMLIVAVLVQVKGKGFGRVWGGDSVSFARRGLEKLVFRLTFVIAALFVIISIVQLLV